MKYKSFDFIPNKINSRIKGLISTVNLSLLLFACSESASPSKTQNIVVNDCESARENLNQCYESNINSTNNLGISYLCAQEIKLVENWCRYTLDQGLNLDEGIYEIDQNMLMLDQGVQDDGVPEQDQEVPIEDQGVPEQDQGTPVIDQEVPMEDQGVPDMGNELAYPNNIPAEHRDDIDDFINQAGNESCLDGLHRYTANLIRDIVESVQTQEVNFVENCLNRGFERVAFRRRVNPENGDIFSFDDQSIAGNGCFDVGGNFYLVPFGMLNLSQGFEVMHFVSISNEFDDFVLSIRLLDNMIIVRKSNNLIDFVTSTSNACE